MHETPDSEGFISTMEIDIIPSGMESEEDEPTHLPEYLPEDTRNNKIIMEWIKVGAFLCLFLVVFGCFIYLFYANRVYFRLTDTSKK